MRHPLLLTILFTLLLISCSQEDEVTPDNTTELKGTFIKSNIRLQYFDASGKMEHEEVIPDQQGNVYVFDGSKLTVNDIHYNTVEQANYQVQEVNGMPTVVLTAGTNKTEFSITTWSNTELVWERPYHNNTYYKGTTQHTAAKSVYVEEFNKQQ